MFNFQFIPCPYACVSEQNGEHISTVTNDDNAKERLKTALSQHYDIDIEDTDIVFSEADKNNIIICTVSNDQQTYIIEICPSWLY